MSSQTNATEQQETPRMVVSALVVTYNSAKEIGNLLDSLPAAAEGLDLRVVVVDNSSSDDTVAVVEARGDARVVRGGGNIGYAAGINVGRAELDDDTDAIAILNPDLVLEPGSLRVLAQALASDRTIGVAVPNVSNSDGTPFHSLRREPTLLTQLGEAAFGGTYWTNRPAALSDTLRTEAEYQRARDVEWASGAALLISRACDQAVGDWREDFFLYSEETDFARRARQAGYRIRYLPEARCLHIGGASGASPQLEALMEVNKLRDYQANHDPVRSLAFRGVLAAQHAVRAKNKPGSKAALDYLLGRTPWSQLPKGDPRRTPRRMAVETDDTTAESQES